MHSFRNILLRWLAYVKPGRAFEWGPGLSTELILASPGVLLTSVEHCKAWYDKAVAQFGDQAHILLKDVNARNSDYATCMLELGPVDFVFIDGRRRVECAVVSMTHLKPGGVIMIHDWCRTNYSDVLRHYAEILEVVDNTAVLRPKLHFPSLVPLLTLPESAPETESPSQVSP